MPECLLSFNDVSTLTDLAFHPCVRINRFEKDRVLSFVPPDGVFEVHKRDAWTGCMPGANSLRRSLRNTRTLTRTHTRLALLHTHR